VALDRLMREVVAPSRHGSPPPVAYFYRGGLYDLILRKVEAVKDAGAAAADHLVRGDFTIRNRTTHTESKFAVTYPRAGTDAFRPVRITFQPNWWLAVELRLDEQVDAPPDPAADPATLARIRALCPAER